MPLLHGRVFVSLLSAGCFVLAGAAAAAGSHHHHAARLVRRAAPAEESDEPPEAPLHNFFESVLPPDQPRHDLAESDVPPEEPDHDFAESDAPPEAPRHDLVESDGPPEEPRQDFAESDEPPEEPRHGIAESDGPPEEPRDDFAEEEEREAAIVRPDAAALIADDLGEGEAAVEDGVAAQRTARRADGSTCVNDRKFGCEDDADCCDAGSGCYRIFETACNPNATIDMLGILHDVTNPSWCLLKIPRCEKQARKVDIYKVAVTEGLP